MEAYDTIKEWQDSPPIFMSPKTLPLYSDEKRICHRRLLEIGMEMIVEVVTT